MSDSSAPFAQQSTLRGSYLLRGFGEASRLASRSPVRTEVGERDTGEDRRRADETVRGQVLAGEPAAERDREDRIDVRIRRDLGRRHVVHEEHERQVRDQVAEHDEVRECE